MIETDLLVVGAGPVGLFAAYYAGFRELSTTVLDSLPQPGGQVSALYPEKLIHDVAGFPAVRGRELVDSLLDQAAQFAPRFVLGETAEKQELLPDGRLLVTTSGEEPIAARAVVVTAGIGRFAPRPLPGGAEYEGRGLTYFVPRPDAMAGRRVVVVGGGDSAVDWALALEGLAESVTVVHRRDAFRAHQHSVTRMRSGRCRVLTPYVVERLVGEQRLTAVVVRDVATGEVEELPCDDVVAALGFVADLGPLESWGMQIESRRIQVDTRMRTTVPMVYAAGDVADYPGKVRLIVVGFGEAATAVNNAAVAIDPSRDLFPGHSTDE